MQSGRARDFKDNSCRNVLSDKDKQEMIRSHPFTHHKWPGGGLCSAALSVSS